MKWTTKPITEPGAYWLFLQNQDGKIIKEVFHIRDLQGHGYEGLHFIFMGDFAPVTFRGLKKWAGPLLPPEETI